MKIRDLSAWESFYWVAKESNFKRAAGRLNIGAPLLSKRIAKLEEDLGVRLFQRSTRKVSLTHEGRGMFPHVQSFLEDAQGLEDRFGQTDEVVGTIRMTCVTAFAHRIMAPIIAEFCELHPKVAFEFEATDGFVDLIDAQMDLAIRVQHPTGADFVFKKLLQNNLVLCASPKYLKAARRPIRKPEDLSSHRLLMLKSYEGCRFKGAAVALGELQGAQKVHCESGLFLTELACRDAGVAVRSLWDVLGLLKSGKLVQVLEKYPLDPFGDMYLVIPTRRLLAHRVRTFVDFLTAKTQHWKH